MSTKTKQPSQTTAPAPDPNTIRLRAMPGQSADAQLAEVAMTGVAANVATSRQFAKGTFGQLGLTECLEAVTAATAHVHAGDLKSLESTLAAQAMALNNIFNELARRAALNLGEYIDATDKYMRLALKAQSQCRATLETLAAIKNPPVIYAKQANIANGPQQVNNGMSSDNRAIRAHAHAGEKEGLNNELLEHQHGNYLDAGAQGQTGQANPHLEAMDARQRAAHA